MGDSRVSRQRIVLSGQSPQLAGMRWESDNALHIGRLHTFEIILTHASISRRHAQVVATARGWVVRDLGSKNGTLLNGVPVDGGDHKLRSQDVLQCGDLILMVETLEDNLPAPAAAPQREPRLKTSGSFVKVQATARPSCEQGLQGVAALPQRQQRREGDQLLSLLRVGHYLSHIHSLDELLQSILDDTVQVLSAQRACILLVDEASGHLDLRRVSFSKRPLSADRCFSRTLALHCFNRGESLLCRDVNTEEQLQKAMSISHGSMASIICALLRSPRKRLGVLHLDRGPLQEPFTQDDFELADAIAASMSVAIENAQLAENQRTLFMQTVTALAQAVEVRDQYTGGHTQRVTRYALMLAEELKLSVAERHQIQIATPLHDIGKIAVDDAVLRKPGRLTPEEFEHMKSHVLKGAAILETIPGLAPMIPIVRSHHERWDGSGYPDRLAQEQISRLARIVAVADAFDAMTSDRPYRPAMPLDKAFAELCDKAGSHFDPECVRAFLSVRHRVESLINQDGRLQQGSPSLTTTSLHKELMRLLNQGAPG
jgi:HD-GYP domain-containing protein (c-di-GMP phosphodiesterase class II)